MAETPEPTGGTIPPEGDQQQVMVQVDESKAETTYANAWQINFGQASRRSISRLVPVWSCHLVAPCVSPRRSSSQLPSVSSVCSSISSSNRQAERGSNLS